jgi:hypothetical protein
LFLLPPTSLQKKKIVIVTAKYYMTIHLKPGFRYELQLRLRCAMYVTQLLKLEKKNKKLKQSLISFSRQLIDIEHLIDNLKFANEERIV